jgi:hypothetical protein
VLQPNEEGKVEIAVNTARFLGRKTIGMFLTTEFEIAGEAPQTFQFSITGISEEQP